MIFFLSSCSFFGEAQELTQTQQSFLLRQEQILERVFAPDSQSGKVRAWYSPDLEHWTPSKTTNIHSFSSLGLHHEDGRLVLSGQHRLQMPTKEEESMQLLWSQLLHFDGEDWRAEIRPFSSDISAHADHQWFEGQLWLQSSPPLFRADQSQQWNTVGRDPLLQDVEHQIRTQNRIWLKGKGLGDPTPVRFQDQVHLFVTRAQIVRNQVQVCVQHYVEQEDDVRLLNEFSGLSVPYATVIDDQLWVLAQRRGRSGSIPVWSRTTDGSSWDDWKAIPIKGYGNNCSSPVLGQLLEKWWIFCSEES